MESFNQPIYDEYDDDYGANFLEQLAIGASSESDYFIILMTTFNLYVTVIAWNKRKVASLLEVIHRLCVFLHLNY